MLCRGGILEDFIPTNKQEGYALQGLLSFIICHLSFVIDSKVVPKSKKYQYHLGVFLNLQRLQINFQAFDLAAQSLPAVTQFFGGFGNVSFIMTQTGY
jgi:hypothetical protein